MKQGEGLMELEAGEWVEMEWVYLSLDSLRDAG